MTDFHKAAGILIRDRKILVTREKNKDFFVAFEAMVAGQEDKTLKMEVFVVRGWIGEITPSNGEEVIEEVLWLDSEIPPGLSLGSIFEHEIIPKLKENGLID